MEKILVTGGTGYIGSHTVIELINSGYSVVIADNLSNSNIDVLEGIKKITGIKPEFHKTDLSDHRQTKDLFLKVKNINSLIHFAAYKAVGESVKQPLKYYHNNLNSLINILEGMKRHHVKNIVFSSSCTVYGQPEALPVTEQSPVLKAGSPYGNTKQISEEIIYDSVSSSKDIRAISLRYFNPIGAHDSAEIGELPTGTPDNLVPFITQTAAGIREELHVFGDDYNTPDGTAVRDYIHIEDLAKAHVTSLNRMIYNTGKSDYEVFNLGTGKGNSVMEVIKSFEQVSGKKLNYKIIGRRAGDVEQVWADTTYANNELDWKAKRTLKEALLSAWKWEKKYRGL